MKLGKYFAVNGGFSNTDLFRIESTADAVSSSRLEYLLNDFGPGSNLQTMIMRLRHLELRLALHYRELPARIFVKDVIDIEHEAKHCGFYADIHTGTKGGRTVALKHLRIFPTTKAGERDRLQGVCYLLFPFIYIYSKLII